MSSDGKKGYVYIVTNKTCTTLYTGVTSNLIKRIYEHKNKLLNGFSKRYNLSILVYYECIETIEAAIAREKQIKAGSRQKKIDLIQSINPDWKDLYESICE